MNADDVANQALMWTEEARIRLRRVPEGVMREMTRQRVERLARQRDLSEVTVELLDAKYGEWADGSAQASSEMAWTEDAKRRMEHVPAFVRGMAVKAIEAYAVSRGFAQITPVVVDEAKTFWGETGQFHQP